MMVSHAFDEVTGCPEDLADSSEITWLAYLCAPNDADCGITPVDLSSCPKPEIRCPASPDELSRDAASAGQGP